MVHARQRSRASAIELRPSSGHCRPCSGRRVPSATSPCLTERLGCRRARAQRRERCGAPSCGEGCYAGGGRQDQCRRQRGCRTAARYGVPISGQAVRKEGRPLGRCRCRCRSCRARARAACPPRDGAADRAGLADPIEVRPASAGSAKGTNAAAAAVTTAGAFTGCSSDSRIAPEPAVPRASCPDGVACDREVSILWPRGQPPPSSPAAKGLLVPRRLRRIGTPLRSKSSRSALTR